MVKLYVKNWRCIEEISIDLSPITLFIGKNSSGKSSLAYAAYFLMKVIERDLETQNLSLEQLHRIHQLIEQLYGAPLSEVVRRQGDKEFYPLIIEIEGTRLEIDRDHASLSVLSRSLHTGYLLPSQRVFFLKMLQFLFRHHHHKAIRVLSKLQERCPVVPPMQLFVEDLMKLYAELLGHYGLGSLGVVIEKVAPISALLVYEFIDSFIGDLKLPLDLASDGLIDLAIIRLFIEKAVKKSLLVIEEPENHKNPIQLIELTRYIAENAIKKELIVIITTHNDIIVHTLAKMVEEKKISPNDVAVYYFERGPECPWTRVRKLKIYEDGTIEDLPDIEKVLTALF